MKSAGDKKKQAPANEHERDFYFDELMTAQPEATQEYFRAKLAANTTKRKSDT
ncbi:MAG: hypothetical protein ABUS57_19800 [Pseudomonadota bacterium]